MNLEKGDYFVVKKGQELNPSESIYGSIIVSTTTKYDMSYTGKIYKVLEINGDFAACELVYPKYDPIPKGFLDISQLDIWPITPQFVEALK